MHVFLLTFCSTSFLPFPTQVQIISTTIHSLLFMYFNIKCTFSQFCCCFAVAWCQRVLQQTVIIRNYFNFLIFALMFNRFLYKGDHWGNKRTDTEAAHPIAGLILQSNLHSRTRGGSICVSLRRLLLLSWLQGD